MDTPLALHAALGAGRAGRAHDRGRALGYAAVNGSRTSLHTPIPAKLGFAERVGAEVVLRTGEGGVVARHRVGG